MVTVTDGLPFTVETYGDIYDSGLNGVPFMPETWPTLNLVFLLLIIGWIGLLVLTGLVVRQNRNVVLPNIDSDSVIILMAWFGVLVLTGYIIRIVHGP